MNIKIYDETQKLDINMPKKEDQRRRRRRSHKKPLVKIQINYKQYFKNYVK